MDNYTKVGTKDAEAWREVQVVAAIGLVVAVVILLVTSLGSIDQGERGVLIRFGEVVGTKDAGIYAKIPLIDRVRKFSTRTQNVIYERENPLTAASRDLQDVIVASVINYRIDANAVGKIYAQYGTHKAFEDNVIRPAVRDTVKATAARYTAEELVTKRSEFTDSIHAELQSRMEDKYIFVERVNVTDLQFSASFTQAIEAKVTAEQKALTAQRDLERVEFEAQQQIERAKAEAEQIRIQAQAITQQGGKDYVQLKAIEKWNGELPMQMVPNATVPFIDLNK